MMKLFFCLMVLAHSVFGSVPYTFVPGDKEVRITKPNGSVQKYYVNQSYGLPGSPKLIDVLKLLNQCNIIRWRSKDKFTAVLDALLNPISITTAQYADCIWRITRATVYFELSQSDADTYFKIVNAYVDHLCKDNIIPNSDRATYLCKDDDWWSEDRSLNDISPIIKVFFRKIEGQTYVIPFRKIEIGKLNPICFNFVRPNPEDSEVARRFVYNDNGVVEHDTLDIRISRSGSLSGISLITPGLIIKTLFGAHARIPFSALTRITVDANPTGRPSEYVHLPGSPFFEAAVKSGLPDGEYLWPLINEEAQPLDALMAEVMLIRKLQEKAHQEKINNLFQEEGRSRKREDYRENQARSAIAAQRASFVKSIPQADSEIINMPAQGLADDTHDSTVAIQAWEKFAQAKWGTATEDERNARIQTMEEDLRQKALEEVLLQQALAKQARLEQEKISRNVAKGSHSKTSKPRHSPAGSSRHQDVPADVNPAVAAIPVPTAQALREAEEAAKEFLKQGRVKYDAVVSLMGVLWQSLPQESLARIAQNTHGSHITFHDTESVSSPFTLVQRHGSGDDTIPGSRAANLVTSTMSFVRGLL